MDKVRASRSDRLFKMAHPVSRPTRGLPDRVIQARVGHVAPRWWRPAATSAAGADRGRRAGHRWQAAHQYSECPARWPWGNQAYWGAGQRLEGPSMRAAIAANRKLCRKSAIAAG